MIIALLIAIFFVLLFGAAAVKSCFGNIIALLGLFVSVIIFLAIWDRFYDKYHDEIILSLTVLGYIIGTIVLLSPFAYLLYRHLSNRDAVMLRNLAIEHRYEQLRRRVDFHSEKFDEATLKKVDTLRSERRLDELEEVIEARIKLRTRKLP